MVLEAFIYWYIFMWLLLQPRFQPFHPVNRKMKRKKKRNDWNIASFNFTAYVRIRWAKMSFWNRTICFDDHILNKLFCFCLKWCCYDSPAIDLLQMKDAFWMGTTLARSICWLFKSHLKPEHTTFLMILAVSAVKIPPKTNWIGSKWYFLAVCTFQNVCREQFSFLPQTALYWCKRPTFYCTYW